MEGSANVVRVRSFGQRERRLAAAVARLMLRQRVVMHAICKALIIATALLSSAACNKTQSSDVDQANAALADARAKYVAAAKVRLANIDAQLHALDQHADARSQELAAQLRTRRDQIAAKLDTIGSQAASGWEDLKKDVDDGVDSITKDLADAVK